MATRESAPHPTAAAIVGRLLRVGLLAALLALGLLWAGSAAAYPPCLVEGPSPRDQHIRWRDSAAVGSPAGGRLIRSVQLPSGGRHFFTWDPVLRRSPNRAWRRHGTDRLVQTVLRVLAGFAVAHPCGARVGVGDLSRPGGGDFGVRFGRPGHASHQNGLDVDIYYPRRDGRELAPTRVSQIDRELSQELVDRFVRAGAERVFVGPNTGLRGPPGVVQTLWHHDNHLHARLPGRSRGHG